MKIEIAFSNVNCAIKVTTPEGNIIDIVPTLPAVAEDNSARPEAAATVTNAAKENAAPATGAVALENNTAKAAALSEKIISMNREYERLKKAVYRAKKKLEATTASLGQRVTATAASCPTLVPAGVHCPVPVVPVACPQVVPHVPHNVPGDNLGKETANITYSNINNNTTAITTKTLSDKSITNSTFIPLAKLPEAYQKIITAWNNLPLPEKLKGLFTDKSRELHALLKQFGETDVHKAIRTVAECPFLLGKSANSRGWIVSFSWLLKPHNMEKVLANKYRDRSCRQVYDCGPEYLPWTAETERNSDWTTNAEKFNTETYANCTANAEELNRKTYPDRDTTSPAACQTRFLPPEEMMQGLDHLSDGIRRNLLEAAAKIFPGYQAA